MCFGSFVLCAGGVSGGPCSIFMFTVFFHLISTLPSVLFFLAVFYSVIITTTKEAAFPRDSGKVPLAMLKCFCFFSFSSVVTGEHE